MKHRFENTGEDFSAQRAAIAWAETNGYSVGGSCAGLPLGLMRGDCDIAKWRNLSVDDRRQLHGYIEFERQDTRHGAATVTIID